MELLFQPIDFQYFIEYFLNKQRTALAAPVVDGIIFCAAPRPPRQS